MQTIKNNSADSFEELLNRQWDSMSVDNTKNNNTSNNTLSALSDKKPKYTKAEKGATLNDFFQMIKKMVLRTMKKDNVEFIPDDGPRAVLDPSAEIDHPVIYYTLISRKPRKDYMKPHFREDIYDRNANGSIARQGAIYGQIFDCDIQFNILASDYVIADKVMNTFEDAMQKYSGYFKKNGISELFFQRQYTDQNLDIYRQRVSVRSLVYRVTIERIKLSFDTTMYEIVK